MSGSEDHSGAGDGDGRPEQARDLQGLLRLSIQHGSAEPQPNQLALIDPERRQFLEAAMSQAASGVSDMLRTILATLQGSDTDRHLAALQLLRDHVDHLDIANEFETMGGLPVLTSCLSSDDAEIRATAAGAIADMLQNNPHCQRSAAAAGGGLLPALLPLVRGDPAPPARLTALQAASALLRDNAPAQRAFCAGDGCGALIAALQSGQPRLQAKAAFLLACLCAGDDGPVRSAALRTGLVEQLAAVLAAPHAVWHEHLLAALLALSERGGPQAVAECQREQLQLCQQLQLRLQLLHGKDEERETLQHCRRLMQICFPVNHDEPDR